MLTLPTNVKIFLSSAPCDMRKQLDGLAGLVQAGMQREPRNGDMYVFCNRRRDMVKVLFFDQQGLCLLVKRMDKGTFQFTVVDGVVQMSSQAFSHFMMGVEFVRSAA
jgi:transposase